MDPAIKQSELTEEFDCLSIDPETGEILEQASEVTVRQLPAFGRHVAALRRRIEAIQNFKQEEVARITAYCDAKTDQLNASVSALLRHAEGLMESANEKRLEYPGIGLFRWRKMPVSVNDEVYEGWDDDAKAEAHNTHQGYFKLKTVTTPDKKAIKEALQKGDSVSGFSLNEPGEQFEFKVEG